MLPILQYAGALSESVAEYVCAPLGGLSRFDPSLPHLEALCQSARSSPCLVVAAVCDQVLTARAFVNATVEAVGVLVEPQLDAAANATANLLYNNFPQPTDPLPGSDGRCHRKETTQAAGQWYLRVNAPALASKVVSANSFAIVSLALPILTKGTIGQVACYEEGQIYENPATRVYPNWDQMRRDHATCAGKDFYRNVAKGADVFLWGASEAIGATFPEGLIILAGGVALGFMADWFGDNAQKACDREAWEIANGGYLDCGVEGVKTYWGGANNNTFTNVPVAIGPLMVAGASSGNGYSDTAAQGLNPYPVYHDHGYVKGKQVCIDAWDQSRIAARAQFALWQNTHSDDASGTNVSVSGSPVPAAYVPGGGAMAWLNASLAVTVFSNNPPIPVTAIPLAHGVYWTAGSSGTVLIDCTGVADCKNLRLVVQLTDCGAQVLTVAQAAVEYRFTGGEKCATGSAYIEGLGTSFPIPLVSIDGDFSGDLGADHAYP